MGLVAFHGNAKIKKFYLDRVRGHEKADEIVKGKYWEDGHGCAIGCTIHGADHAKYETKLGIPRQIAELEEDIFEGLPVKEGEAFPAKFLNIIIPGADLSQVRNKFLHWLLMDKTNGVIKYAKTDRTKKAIQDIGDIYARKINGEVIKYGAWKKLKAAAYAAAKADNYAHTAIVYPAVKTDRAAALAACAAINYVDGDTDARKASKEKSHIIQMNKLLELLKAAPVIKKEAA